MGFSASMNFPPPVYPNPYGKYLKTIVKCAIENCEESMRCAVKDLVDRSIIVDVPTKIAVSVDGTWQKRYGYNPLRGAACYFNRKRFSFGLLD